MIGKEGHVLSKGISLRVGLTLTASFAVRCLIRNRTLLSIGGHSTIVKVPAFYGMSWTSTGRASLLMGQINCKWVIYYLLHVLTVVCFMQNAVTLMHKKTE